MIRGLSRVAGTAFTSLRVPTAQRSVLPLANVVQRRFLNIHEYQGQKLLAEAGIATPKGIVATTPKEAFDAAKKLGGDCVIKAQVLAGGRGLGHFTSGFRGGVHMCTSPEQAQTYAEQMLGQTLVTKQTGAQGKPCNVVYLAERVYARRELYFAIAMDRASGGPVVVASNRGGTSIEKIAEEDPSAIMKIPVDLKTGMTNDQVAAAVAHMGFADASLAAQAGDIVGNLFKLFSEDDATLVEINPLIETHDGRVLCADSKLNFDDNAEFRQKALWELRDTSQEDSREVEAAKHDLNYIGLDGNIGCIVNGAGLAMSTLDIIKLYGGSPANFLDVGGGASQDQVKEALKILQHDRQVKAILINIFGGIMRCDHIALGLINAAAEVNLTVPIVVRLKGTRDREGQELIDKSGLRIIGADDLDDAAQKAVTMASIMSMAKEVGVNVQFQLPL